MAEQKTIGRLPAIFRSLEDRNYRLFFTGQLISLCGTWMQTVAQSWLVYRLTNSPLLLGWVGFSAQIPVFLLSPIAGVTADRHNRQRLVIATQAASMVLAGVLAALTLTGRIQIVHIIMLSAALGVVNAFDIPARQSFVAELVGRERLSNAIALNSSMFNGARIAGPAVAGLVVAAVGEGWCFLLNSISYVAVIAGLLMMQVRTSRRPLMKQPALHAMNQGFRYIYRAKPIRALLLLLGVVSLTSMPYTVLMPVFAEKILYGGPGTLGALMGASGCGAVAGALMLAARQGLRGLGRWVAVSTAALGAGLILFAQSRLLWLSIAIMVPIGFSMIVQMASSNTLVQAMVSDEYRGRVMSVYSMMFMGMAPVGALLAGWGAGLIGAPGVLMAGGSIALVGAAVFATRLRHLRVLAREMIVAQQMAGGDPAEEVTAPAA
jgi:MFS family permease